VCGRQAASIIQKEGASRQQTADRRKEPADSRQQTAGCKQQTADSKQQTADSRQQTADSRQDLDGSPAVVRLPVPTLALPTSQSYGDSDGDSESDGDGYCDGNDYCVGQTSRAHTCTAHMIRHLRTVYRKQIRKYSISKTADSKNSYPNCVLIAPLYHFCDTTVTPL
jgi:hypothetical protein